MSDTISILLEYVPRYGEMLIGVGAIALTNQEEILENEEAMQKLKDYLLTNAPKDRVISKLILSEEFQRILLEYTGRIVAVKAIQSSIDKDKKVKILLARFFASVIWPILVNRYLDRINNNDNKVAISINIKKNVYMTIYEKDEPTLFFSEFKELLSYNFIVISGVDFQENGDILLNLLVPVAPHAKF